jgi:hypothetical protein
MVHIKKLSGDFAVWQHKGTTQPNFVTGGLQKINTGSTGAVIS